MKLATEAPKPIRVVIRRKGEKAVSMVLHDTTLEEVAAFAKNVMRPHADPFGEGEATRVAVTQRPPRGIGGREVAINFSFHGPSPAETKLILVEALAEVKSEQLKTA